MPFLARLGDLAATVAAPTVPIGGAIAGNVAFPVMRTFVEGFLVARIGDTTVADDLCTGENPHCLPFTSTGSTTVFCEGLPVHRIGDLRTCGDITIPFGPRRTFVGLI